MAGIIGKAAVSLSNKRLFNAGSELQYKEFVDGSGLDLYDAGWRMYNAQIGRMNQLDIMADKYSGITPYNYAANLPTKVNDPDGMDWIFSTETYKDKQGNSQTRIKLTFSGAILNSSGKQIDIPNFIKEQEKIFKNIFEQGNVSFNLVLTEVKSKEEVGEFQHLIEIKDGTFKENGEATGGTAAYGGKYIELSSAGINSDGTVLDKRTLAHEAGHSGGLVHPWDFSKYKNGTTYTMNNREVNMETQKFHFSWDLMSDDSRTNNFMGYTKKAVQIAQSGGGTQTERALIQYYNNNVGKATGGQIQTIINNIYSGAINNKNSTGIQEK